MKRTFDILLLHVPFIQCARWFSLINYFQSRDFFPQNKKQQKKKRSKEIKH